MFSSALAQINFTENFTGTTASGWNFYAAPGDTLPVLTATTIDTPGTGWLRLNTNTGNQSTAALLDNQVFSVNARLEVTMDYAFHNGSGADGITFFLVDGSVNAASFTPGAYGGSLGYANRTGADGMVGGYLGVGFDNFGNYSNGSEGRNGGQLGDNDATLLPNRIAVRGPGSGQTGYDYIASSAPLETLSGGGQMDFPSYTTRPDQTGADYRSFKLVIDANNQLTVEMKFGASASYITAFTADLSGYARPDTLKIGFTASTGGSNEIHEIRNLSVTTTPWSTGSGAYEWDNGAGTTAWGSTAGGEANSNWYSSVSADDNKTPLRDSDVLFGNKPTNNGTNNTQAVTLANNIEVRNMTFDSSINYSIGTVGDGKVITLGDTAQAGLPSINVNDYNGAYARHKINTDLALVEDLAIRNFSYSTLCINGTTGTNGKDITVSGFGAVNFNGDISGTGDLFKNGAGITTINNDNSGTWSGNVTVNQGMLVVTAAGALGDTTGTTTVASGATLAFRNDVNYTANETITLNGSGITRSTGELAGALHNDGGANTFAGTVVLASNSAVGSRDGSLSLNGVISETGGARSLAKVGAGTVVLGAANTYTGATIINEGELRLANASALSASTNVQLAGGVLELGAANYTAALGTGAGQVQFTSDGGFSAFGAARNVNLGGGTALTWNSTASFLGDNQALLLSSDVSDNTLTFQNAIDLNGGQREFRVANGSAAIDATLSGNLTDTGVGGLIKTGTGTLNLTGANNYTGATEIRAGALRGNLSANSNLQLNGGVREINTNLGPTLGTGANQVQWTGSGGFAAESADPRLRLNNSATAVTWGTTSGFVADGGTLILGSTSAAGTLQFDTAINLGAGTRTIQVIDSAAVSTRAEARLTQALSNGSLIVTGNGRLDSSVANNSLAGTVEVRGAELRLNTSAGTMTSVTGFTVTSGGTLTLDNAGTHSSATGGGNNTSRIGNSTGINLQGGTLAFWGRTDNNSTAETIGTITLGSGANTLDVVNNRSGRSTTLTSASLSRSAGATIDFVNTTQTNGTYGTGNTPRLAFTSAPALDDGILAYGTVNSADFATLSGSSIVAYTGYDTGAQTGWTATADNAAPATDQTLTADRTINSLKLASGIDIAQAGFTVTLQSGGLLTTGSTVATLSGGTLTTGNANELIVHAYNTGGSTINSTLTGTGGLTKSGTETLTLSGTTANTLTGTTTVNAGTLALAKSGGVTAIAGNITVGDGRGIDTLKLAANEQIADTATVTLRGGEVGNAANVARFELNGAVSVGDASRMETFDTLTITGNSVLDFGGGSVCSPTFLYLKYLSVDANSLLTITNWLEFTDFLLVEKATFDDTQLSRVIFDGYPGTAKWQNYDSNYYQITPVPEPATYGLLGLGGLTVFAVFRRRRVRAT
ncbi:MAG: autotransporter-associated beta strand repeat-containing protein [Verrucomicrobia bacterium]|nr:autotransporter-associated beta strand repeat-containing protein [Verrucomicrobiota bacterium]